MSGERPPRGRPRPKSKGFDDVPVLSDEEVERRVDVRGGGTPRGPAERPVRASRQPRPPERTVARDSILLIGLVIVGLVAVRLLLPEGPLTGSPTQSPSGTLVVIGSVAPPSSGPTRTPGLVTLEPVATPSPDAGTTPGASTAPTATPAPTPTLKPGQTPKPTPKVTAAPTPGPTAPNRATVLVKLIVVTNSGGSGAAEPADWTINITGEGAGAASTNNFAGSASGTSVSVPAGQGYRIRDNNARSDYAAFPVASEGCTRPDGGGGLTAGTTVTCTITRDDKPRVRVITNVNGSESAGSVNISVDGIATPTSFSGSEAGTVVVIGFGLAYAITASGLTDYDKSQAGACSGALPLDAAATTCTFTFDYVPPPSPVGVLVPLFPLLPARRWQTIPTG